MKRRTMIAGGGALALAGIGGLAFRPGEVGGMHDAYFKGLSAALKRAGLMRPTLVIDRARLVANVAAIRKSVDAANLPLRVVAKSLPSPKLLEAIMTGMGSWRLMVFSADMLLQLLELNLGGDYLLGKPLPVGEFARVIKKVGKFGADSVQWLIDTPERMREYALAGHELDVTWKANLEIDVGLHRGGLTDYFGFESVMEAGKANGERYLLTGLMGYDPHVPKMPSPDKAWAKSQEAYRKAIGWFGKDRIDTAGMTFNSAGSPTFRRHCQRTAANEVSVGSAFVKPGDFDLDDLADLLPAAFIATPVIKACKDQALPGVEALSGAMHWWDRNTQRGFFIHGGHWLAKPVSPEGLQYSKLFGRSSNQELLTGSKLVELKPDDHVFLRPDQSEALFLQFGDIAVYDRGEIAEMWPTLPVSA